MVGCIKEDLHYYVEDVMLNAKLYTVLHDNNVVLNEKLHTLPMFVK